MIYSNQLHFRRLPPTILTIPGGNDIADGDAIIHGTVKKQLPSALIFIGSIGFIALLGLIKLCLGC